MHSHDEKSSREGRTIDWRGVDIPQNLDAREPVWGVVPHEVVYLERTLLHVRSAVPDAQDGALPWLSVAVDANVTNVRALFLSYRAPSVASVMMVLRDYVWRWGCFPRLIVIDRGWARHSHELKVLCDIFNIELRFCRGHCSPAGASVETLLTLSERELLCGLEATAMEMTLERVQTADADPVDAGVWRFADLYRALERFLCYLRFNEHIHPALGMTQASFQEMRLREVGCMGQPTIALLAACVLSTVNVQ
jgi:putative transposase